jgi:hypothetical protein
MHSCGMQISMPQLTNIVYLCLMGAELLVSLVELVQLNALKLVVDLRDIFVDRINPFFMSN